MKNLFFLTALALGMMLGTAAYLTGGVFLLATGLSFTTVIVGCLFAMASQLRRFVDSGNAVAGGLAPAV